MGNPLCASKAAESDSPVLHAGGDIFQLRGEVGVLLHLAQHLERAEDGQSGADEGEELLVEDEERLELDLAPRHAGEIRARLTEKT